MKKLIFLLFAFMIPITFLIAQESANITDANGRKQGHWTGKSDNGKVRYEGSFSNDKPFGEWKRFHENGRIKAQLHYFPNTDKASAELFDINGIRYAKGNYKGTLKDSTWSYFNGERLVGREIYSNGKKNGLSQTFFENGVIATESMWVNGVFDGVSRRFFPSGKKKTETMFRQGKKQGLNLVYYESGQTEIKGQYDNDQPDGIWRFNNEGGNLKYELRYKAGILLNPEVVDRIQADEFKAFDRAKGKLKDPEEFSQKPEEYLRK